MHNTPLLQLSAITPPTTPLLLTVLLSTSQPPTVGPDSHKEQLTLLLHTFGIQGKLWKILQETYRKVNIRVLHPLIPATEYTTLMRGLPEGSKLSPPLFGILVADLLVELRTKHPTANTYASTPTGQTWLGAIAYVDDIVLISSSPEELQRMLNTCQPWCSKSHLQINTDKTKIVHFHKSISVAQRQYTQEDYKWYIQVYDRPTRAFNKIFLDEEITFKYLGVTLDQELTMKPLQQQILDKIKKSNGKLQGLKKDIKTSRHLYSPERSILGQASTTPKTILHLWKYCVLVQATQYIRYISPELVPDIQTKLQKSLQDTFECYGQPTNLLCDLGVPALSYYQHKDLIRLHYRLSNMPNTSLLFSIYNRRLRRTSDTPTPTHPLRTLNLTS
jgi:hypothetical protein